MPDSLVGRSRELAWIAAFLKRAATDGEALVLRGDPGVGKTALLNAAAELAAAADVRVLRAGGVQFESGITFAGLHQVLDPLRAEFSNLEGAHRQALDVALGSDSGDPPGPLLVAAAALSLFRQAAARRPLLLILDDLPWIDRASASVLGFVARRLPGSHTGFLAAARPAEEGFFDPTGLPEGDVPPLDETASSALLSARFPALSPRTRRRVLADARGNPLALLELPAALDGQADSTLAGVPIVLPLSRSLQEVFASRVTELPSRTRRALLLAALDSSGELGALDIVADSAPALDDLAPAERARVLYIEPSSRRLAFRHPLIRSAVVDLSTSDERRAAHRALAERLTGEPDRQVWHLAEATVGADENVARLLEQAAERVLRRGDAVGAVAALARASELSPRGAERTRRLAKAAYTGAYITGELRSVRKLLANARGSDPEPDGSLQATVATAMLLLSADGDVDTAYRLLVSAIENIDGEAACHEDLAEALYLLQAVCFFAGRPDRWDAFARALDRLEPLPLELSLCARTVPDPVRTAAGALDDLDAAISRLGQEQDPTRILRVAYASQYVDRYSGCREALWRVVADGREGGAVTSAINALIVLGFDDFLTGQWDQAQQLLDESVDLCSTHHYRLIAWAARHVQALLAAARGDHDRTQTLADGMIRWSTPRRIRAIQVYAWHALGLAALGRGDFEQAYQQASKISPAGTLAPYAPYAVWVMLDLVEAAVHTGRHAQAAAHVAAIREANVARLSSRLALLSCGSAAVAAADRKALGIFEAALTLPGIDRWPFDLARVQLAFGERLRRAQATRQARLHLTAALDAFDRLDAAPWALRAGNELRATGQTKPRAHKRDRDTLTPQEREIATLAATGLTNKQIGERLFLSHRTVSGHLHRTFPKLGISSRAALRDALASLPPNEPDRRDNPQPARR